MSNKVPEMIQVREMANGVGISNERVHLIHGICTNGDTFAHIQPYAQPRDNLKRVLMESQKVFTSHRNCGHNTPEIEEQSKQRVSTVERPSNCLVSNGKMIFR